MTLVEQSRAHDGVMASRVGHRSGHGVPGQLPPPPQVNVEARPAVKGQGVEERLHGVQDALRYQSNTDAFREGRLHSDEADCVFVLNPP